MPNPDENIDTGELHKFELLSEDWWNPQGSLKTLHVINPLRLKYIDEAAPLVGKKVLDIGCGGGLLSEAMASMGAKVTAIDANQSAINVAQEHAIEMGYEIDYLHGSAEKYAAQSPASYDLITCMELLEHVPDPGSLLSTCATLLRPGGDLIVSTLNRNIRSYAMAVLAAEYLLNLVPRGTHEYAKFIKPSEIARQCRQMQFDVQDISGMHYLPGIDHCMLNKDPSVNYLLHARARSR